MPARDDITSLFQAPATPDPFRQGEILTFDPATGANTVRLGGAVLTDLPILNQGDTVNLRGRVGDTPGDAVILLKRHGAMAILGRIISPGSEAMSSVAVDFYAETYFNTVPANITQAHQTFAELNITTPPWANSVLINAITHLIVANTSGASDSVRVMTDINGGVTFGGETIHQVPDANFQTTLAPLAIDLEPGASTQVRSRIRCNGATPWPLGMKACYLNVSAIFRKV